MERVIGRIKVRIFLVVLLIATAAGPVFARAHAVRRGSSGITARAAILLDNRTGEILWQRNPDLALPPASTTKIVTAMVALHSGRLEDTFSVSSEAAHMPPSKIFLRAGWRMRLLDLVYAILLNSANDASVVIAEGLSGSVPAFAERMNAQARSMGAVNSHFVNPNGLPAADHYSTAHDLARMFSAGLRDPLFEQILSTQSLPVLVSPRPGSFRPITLHSHNRLLGNYRIHVIGKTGWTVAAKKCFVGAAQADGRELIVAVLGSRDLWGDLKRLIEFGIDGASSPPVEIAQTDAGEGSSEPAALGDDSEDGGDVPAARKYAVRVGTFRHLQAAKRLKNQVAHSGYPAKIEPIRQHGRRWYRVSVGTYPNREAAERAAKALQRSHQHVTPLVVASE